MSIHPLTDDDWCEDCGELRPCGCDVYYDESEDADEWMEGVYAMRVIQ